jgi:hypothetical protein
MKISYLARVVKSRQFYRWGIVGVNGKAVLLSGEYKKYSYALYRAKAFVANTTGVRLDV